MGLFSKKATYITPKSAKKANYFASYSWSILVKPVFVLLCTLFAYIVYSNWYNLLNKLDNGPIKAYALTHKPQFTTNADIRETLSKIPQLKGYFSQDIGELEKALREMPWVQGAVVRKIWPDKLSLSLLEYKPVAVWNRTSLLSEQGDVFSLPEGRFDSTGLPTLAGPDSESKKALAAWSKIGSDLKDRKLELKSLSVDNRGSWEVTLSNNIVLKLGRGDWIPKIDRFVTIFPEIDVPEGKRLAYVDLRYEHGASVGFSNQ